VSIETTKHRSGPSLFAVILVSILTSVLASVATIVVMGRLGLDAFVGGAGDEGADVEVPAVLGMRPEIAGELLDGRGLRLVVTEERPDAEATVGTIAAQDPLRGSRVASGASVEVVLSTGIPKVVVPSVAGRTVAEGRAALEAAGFAIGEISETGEGAPGTVASTTPAGGTEAESGATVALVTVSAAVVVPDVMRQGKRKAEEAITAAGFTVETKWGFNEMRPPNIVLEQSPAAGEMAAPGSAVTLTLNRNF